jgi:hypothetical protein
MDVNISKVGDNGYWITFRVHVTSHVCDSEDWRSAGTLELTDWQGTAFDCLTLDETLDASHEEKDEFFPFDWTNIQVRIQAA